MSAVGCLAGTVAGTVSMLPVCSTAKVGEKGKLRIEKGLSAKSR